MSTLLEQTRALAVASRNAEAAYNQAFSVWQQQLEPLPPDRFWELLPVFRRLIQDDLDRSDLVERAAREFIRKAATGQFYFFGSDAPCPPYSVEDGHRFAVSWDAWKQDLSQAGDSCQHLDFGRSDDSYGDLMDSLPLAGPGVARQLIDDEFFSMGEFEVTVERALADKRLSQFVLRGENYIGMYLDEVSRDWFANEAMNEARDK